MKRLSYGIIALAIIFGFSGCNKAASDVQPTYISSFKYDSKSCSELKNELDAVEERASAMSSKVDKIKDTQDTKLAWGWLFWPSYIVIDDNNEEAKELGQIKGEHKALKTAMKSKDCYKK